MLTKKKARNGFSPSRVLVGGYVALIFLGMLLLMTPFAVKSGGGLSWYDALFTATSATCVTGLTVLNVGAELSIFGQLVVLALIQIGGMGLMLVSTSIFLLLGRRISFRNRVLIQQSVGSEITGGMVRLLKAVLVFTFTLEFFGALILSWCFYPFYGWPQSFYYGIFHSVSAFCNAGFDLFGTSLVSFQDNWLVLLTMMALIILGGLGFIVVTEIYQKKSWQKLSLHSKITVYTTLILIVLAALLILVSEFYNPATLGELTLGNKILNSLFHAVTPRTAGFNTLDTAAFKPATIFLTMILMFIGASPGSTGGGIKTTTFAALMAVVYSMSRGHPDVQLFNRRLPKTTIYRALSVTLIALGIVCVITGIFLSLGEADLQASLFEVISAFGTVGLSLGITSGLDLVAKILLVITMFIGRVGPLTIAYALTQRQGEDQRYHLPYEGVNIG